MKSGLYKYQNLGIDKHGELVINLTETEKEYVFKLVKNNLLYSPAQLDMMFFKKETVRLNKKRNPHEVNIYDEYFVIYPYQAGIPFTFKYMGGNNA